MAGFGRSKRLKAGNNGFWVLGWLKLKGKVFCGLGSGFGVIV